MRSGTEPLSPDRIGVEPMHSTPTDANVEALRDDVIVDNEDLALDGELH